MTKTIDAVISTHEYAYLVGKDVRTIQVACKNKKDLPQVRHVKRIGREYVLIMKSGYEKYFVK